VEAALCPLRSRPQDRHPSPLRLHFQPARPPTLFPPPRLPPSISLFLAELSSPGGYSHPQPSQNVFVTFFLFSLHFPHTRLPLQRLPSTGRPSLHTPLFRYTPPRPAFLVLVFSADRHFISSGLWTPPARLACAPFFFPRGGRGDLPFLQVSLQRSFFFFSISPSFPPLVLPHGSFSMGGRSDLLPFMQGTRPDSIHASTTNAYCPRR